MNQYNNQNQDVQYNKLFINNNWYDGKNGKTYNKLNSFNGKMICNFVEGDKFDVDRAYDAAQNAYNYGSKWRNMNKSDRGYLLNRLADLFDKHHNTLANLESLDTGKLYQNAFNDVEFAKKTIRYFGGYADKLHGQTMQSNHKLDTQTYYDGYGVIGQIMSCNNPIVNCAYKMGAALAAGCTIIMKPHENTCLTTLYIAQLTKDAGFPDGVFNVITGYGNTAGFAIANHMGIHKVSFSGNGDNARNVMLASAQSNLKKVSFDLNNRHTLVVFNDYDLDDAVNISHYNLFNNNNYYHGQHNVNYGNRTYVHEDIYDEFVRRSVNLARNRKIGNQFDRDTHLGPLTDGDRYNKFMNFVDMGKKQGARLDYGGKQYGNQGWFVEPTIFSNVNDEMNFHRSDFNGPVQCILKFKNLDEVIYRTNNNYNDNNNFNYYNGNGLTTGILTNNINHALAFTKYVLADNVWVNYYQGFMNNDNNQYGYNKDFGHGYDLGKYRVDKYLKNKTVTIRLHSNYHNYNYNDNNYNNNNNNNNDYNSNNDYNRGGSNY